jgi:SAM-dependent methyltransferase
MEKEVCVLPEGWTKQVSKTTNKVFYVHRDGKKQWHQPNEKIEQEKNEIKSFFEQGAVSKASYFSNQKKSNFLSFLHFCLVDEITTEFQNDYLNNFEYNVLDVGCGFGDDVKYWMQLKASRYVGLDYCEMMIKILNKNEFFRKMKGTGIVGDLCDAETWQKIKTSEKYFDILACKYSAQYAFCEKESTRMFLNGLKNCVSDRGFVVITIIDEEFWSFRLSRNNNIDNIESKSIGNFAFSCNYDYQTLKTGTFANKYYILYPDEKKWIPEWFISKEMFIKEAQNQGLHLAFECNMASFASFIGLSRSLDLSNVYRLFRWKTSHEPRLKEMLESNHASAEDWSNASLFKTFVFCKNKESIPKSIVSLQKDFTSFFY